MEYSISQISQAIGGKRIGCKESIVSWILTDSRSLFFPQQSIFFALQGTHDSGEKYVSQLYEKGVCNFVVTTPPADIENYSNANFLVVSNTLAALQKLAAWHRSSFQIPVVGITGSNGKTIVKEWLYHILENKYRITRSPRSYNSQIGVPLSVWRINQETELALIEAGISKPGEMDELWQIVKPNIGVITNIGEAHQENFSSLQEKCLEKLKLFRECDILIYNADNELLQECVNRSVVTAREIAWSRNNPEKPLFIYKETVDIEHGSTTIRYKYLGFDSYYTIPFTDQASIDNSLQVLAVSLYLMVSPDDIRQRMATLESVAMRLEIKEGKNGNTIINDTYNSDLTSLGIALDYMFRLPQKEESPKYTLILSDVLQTGMSARALYKKVDQLINVKSASNGHGITRFIGIGPNISQFNNYITIPNARFFNNTEEFLCSGELKKMQQETILLKGARRYEFDHITECLEQKVHETILEVNMQALAENLNWYRNKLKTGTRIVCMVKADAYGVGAIDIAKKLQECRVNYMAVAVADEGRDLRKAGITSNIMIMNPESTSYKTMIDNKLEPEIYSFKVLNEIIKAAQHEGVTRFPIHIKFDTGMHRLGFQKDDIEQLVYILTHQSSVMPISVFSHFAGSDSPAFDDFTHQQAQLFTEMADMFQASFKHKILRHICNSAGIERFPEYHFDMVRLGLGLYGIDPIDNRTLSTVATLKTRILQIRHLKSTETVGYSRKGTLKKASTIAAIPIGYADGLNRHLGNRNCYCLVNGQKAEYVGNICMDVALIDVTDVSCNEGDVVEIFGPNLPVTVLSDKLGTIPYEVLTCISPRVKRVYYSE